METRITRHFGIAPLQCGIPAGLQTLTLSAEAALLLPPGQKPYWAIKGGAVTIITDEDGKAVSEALKFTTPGQEK